MGSNPIRVAKSRISLYGAGFRCFIATECDLRLTLHYITLYNII